MKRKTPTELAQLIQGFFEEYLPGLRGMSTNTIHSYRDAMVLFLRFLARDTHQRIETLEITDLIAARVEKFLISLELERGNGITTRNTRLAALHTFARFLVMQRPQRITVARSRMAMTFMSSMISARGGLGLSSVCAWRLFPRAR